MARKVTQAILFAPPPFIMIRFLFCRPLRSLCPGSDTYVTADAMPLIPGLGFALSHWQVEEFLEVFLCCPIVQGYGLTESVCDWPGP
jgi:hypothetical protein